MDSWQDMSDQIAQRLAEGDLEYAHDPADKKPTAQLVKEIEEELLDVCAWSMFAWQRIQAIKAQFDELERRDRRISEMTPVPTYVT